MKRVINSFNKCPLCAEHWSACWWQHSVWATAMFSQSLCDAGRLPWFKKQTLISPAVHHEEPQRKETDTSGRKEAVLEWTLQEALWETDYWMQQEKSKQYFFLSRHSYSRKGAAELQDTDSMIWPPVPQMARVAGRVTGNWPEMRQGKERGQVRWELEGVWIVLESPLFVARS